MARTVIQHDGAEAIEETGYGRITELKHDGQARNAQVFINAEHLDDPVSGWVDTSWMPTWGPVNAIYAGDLRCWYRIVVHRRKGVDLAKSFDSLAKREKVRDVLELKEAPAPRGGAARGGAATAVAEAAPPAQAAPPAVAPPSAPPPPPAAPEASQGEAPPANGSAPRRGPRVQEAKQWEPTNSDGSPNFGSYAFAAAVGMVELAQDLWLKGHEGVPITDDVRVAIARLGATLLRVADDVQAHVRRDGRSDRMDTSHVRARGAVRSAVEALPVPWEADRNARAAWVSSLEHHGDWIMATARGLAGLE